MLAVFAGAIAVLMAYLVVTYYRGGRGRPWTTFEPRWAWHRAGIYFCFCYLASYTSGGMDRIVNSPVVTAAQKADPVWVAYTIGALAFILVAYAGVWAHFTPTFDRPRKPLMSAVFGFLWGSSSGQLFVAVWVLADKSALPTRGAWLLTYVILAAFQPNFHNIYWDHYIAPEHDTRMTQKIKALCCHIPNLAITLTYLALYGNYLIFVTLQVIACVAAGIAMRYPAPWATAGPLDFAHRSDARIPRATGYVSADPQTDPYTPFYRGWHPADDPGPTRTDVERV